MAQSSQLPRAVFDKYFKSLVPQGHPFFVSVLTELYRIDPKKLYKKLFLSPGPLLDENSYKGDRIIVKNRLLVSESQGHVPPLVYLRYHPELLNRGETEALFRSGTRSEILRKFYFREFLDQKQELDPIFESVSFEVTFCRPRFIEQGLRLSLRDFILSTISDAPGKELLDLMISCQGNIMIEVLKKVSEEPPFNTEIRFVGYIPKDPCFDTRSRPSFFLSKILKYRDFIAYEHVPLEMQGCDLCPSRCHNFQLLMNEHETALGFFSQALRQVQKKCVMWMRAVESNCGNLFIRGNVNPYNFQKLEVVPDRIAGVLNTDSNFGKTRIILEMARHNKILGSEAVLTGKKRKSPAISELTIVIVDQVEHFLFEAEVMRMKDQVRVFPCPDIRPRVLLVRRKEAKKNLGRLLALRPVRLVVDNVHSLTSTMKLYHLLRNSRLECNLWVMSSCITNWFHIYKLFYSNYLQPLGFDADRRGDVQAAQAAIVEELCFIEAEVTRPLEWRNGSLLHRGPLISRTVRNILDGRHFPTSVNYVPVPLNREKILHNLQAVVQKKCRDSVGYLHLEILEKLFSEGEVHHEFLLSLLKTVYQEGESGCELLLEVLSSRTNVDLHCPICLEEKDLRDIRGTECGHHMCRECLVELATTRSRNPVRCPMCRTNFVKPIRVKAYADPVNPTKNRLLLSDDPLSAPDGPSFYFSQKRNILGQELEQKSFLKILIFFNGDLPNCRNITNMRKLNEFLVEDGETAGVIQLDNPTFLQKLGSCKFFNVDEIWIANLSSWPSHNRGILNACGRKNIRFFMNDRCMTYFKLVNVDQDKYDNQIPFYFTVDHCKEIFLIKVAANILCPVPAMGQSSKSLSEPWFTKRHRWEHFSGKYRLNRRYTFYEDNLRIRDSVLRNFTDVITLLG
jgi:hypothetical protein